MSLLRIVMTLAFVLGAWACAWAEDEPKKAPDYRVYELGEIQVQGERSVAKEVSLTRSLDAEEISRTGAQTLPEALRFLPGLNVSTTGRKNTGSAPFTGFTHAQTTFLIDGVPYYEPYQNDTNLNAFPTDIVGRIDAIRGTSSVLYGAGGMGGVINVITKQATDRPTMSAYLETGDYNTWNAGLSHGNKINDFYYWFSAKYHTSDGWRLPMSYNTPNGQWGSGKNVQKGILQDSGKRHNSYSENISLWGKVGYEPNKDSAYYVTGFYTKSNWGDPWNIYKVVQYFNQSATSGAFTGFDRVSRYEDYGVDFDAKQRLTDVLVARLKLFYHGHEDDYESYAFDPGNQSIPKVDPKNDNWYYDKSTYKDRSFGGSALLDWEVHETDTLRFAFHYKKDIHNQRDADWLRFHEATAFTGSAAVENEWRPIKGLNLVAGVAYNWFDVDDVDKAMLAVGKKSPYKGDYYKKPDIMESVDPMFGISYTFSDSTKIFGSVAHKSRFPSLKELFSSSSGNPELKPEKAMNYVLGVERPFFDDTLLVNISGFYSNVWDRIYGDRFNDIQNENYGQTVIYGVDTSVTWKPRDDFQMRLGYTYADARNTTSDRVTDRAVGVPHHKFAATMQYVVPSWKTRLDLSGLILSDQYTSLPTPSDPDIAADRIPGYAVVNFRATQPITDNFEVYLQINNMFDAYYEESYGYPAHGREFLAGVKMTF